MALHLRFWGLFSAAGLGDGLLYSAWIGRELQGGVDALKSNFGPGSLSDMDGSPVLALHGRRDAHLAREDRAQLVPGVVYAAGLELRADGMNEDIGQQADEQMGIDTAFCPIEDRTQSQVRLERTEDRFQVSQHRIGLP